MTFRAPAWVGIAAFSCAAGAFLRAAELPENLALKATARASSEHSAPHAAKHVNDGKIPAANSRNDAGQAWCANGSKSGHQAELTLEWAQPVSVVEVVYYGRTSWFAEECWKDYELYLDQASQPLVKGWFQMGHGPQRVPLPSSVSAKLITFKFTSSYGGPNPGASEIQVFASHPAADALPPFKKLAGAQAKATPLDKPIVESPELKQKLFTGGLGFQKLLLIQRRELNPSHVYTYHVEGFGAGGGLFFANLDARSSSVSLKQLVASPEGQILDCDLSPDGREILFSWRPRKNTGYQVFTIRIDGSGLHQLTDGPHHNYNACWLPDGRIAFLSTRTSRFAYCWISPVGVLHRMNCDGSEVFPLSANIVNDFTPSVLADGRIIYSRWEYVDKPAIPIQSLWTIHPDGTGLAGYFGNRVLSPATFMEARSIPGTAKVLCLLTSHNGPCRGAIGIIDPAFGNNSQSAIQNLTPEVDIGLVDKGNGNNIRGPYENPFPLDADYFLVSKRGTIIARTYSGEQQTVILHPQGELGYYSPQPLRSRQTPPVLASTLSLSSNSWATVVLQDVYRGLTPAVQRGEVKEICVVEEMRKPVRTEVANRAFGFQFPVISCGATYAGKKVWGYAPVAEDGSACFQVPPGVPIYFMALDAQGRAVQRMRTFTHLMPGETQGCVGCHEPRQQTSGAAHPPVVPEKVNPLRPPEWGAGVGFDYSSVVQPVLDQHCVKCHSGVTPEGKLDLCGDKTDFFNVSYEYLARGRKKISEGEYDNPYTSWIPTYNGMETNILLVDPKAWGSPRSKLADLVLAGHPDANGKKRVELETNALRKIMAWIDLNVPYYGSSETAYPTNKGCRQILPANLEKTLADVARRRCAECHSGGKIPRQVWTRITHPHLNAFLVAPLAKTAGGSQACGLPVFVDTQDPDYRAILNTFTPVTRMLEERPRMDMAGAHAAEVDRSCLGKLE
jgi:hypothetical protein